MYVFPSWIFSFLFVSLILFFFFSLVKNPLNWVLETVPGIYREAIGQLLNFHESATSSDSGSGIQLQIKTLEHRCMSL